MYNGDIWQRFLNEVLLQGFDLVMGLRCWCVASCTWIYVAAPMDKSWDQINCVSQCSSGSCKSYAGKISVCFRLGDASTRQVCVQRLLPTLVATSSPEAGSWVFNGIHGPLVEICKVFSASLVIQIYPQHVASLVFRYLIGCCWPHFSDGKCADATQLRWTPGSNGKRPLDETWCNIGTLISKPDLGMLGACIPSDHGRNAAKTVEYCSDARGLVAWQLEIMIFMEVILELLRKITPSGGKQVKLH